VIICSARLSVAYPWPCLSDGGVGQAVASAEQCRKLVLGQLSPHSTTSTALTHRAHRDTETQTPDTYVATMLLGLLPQFAI
jgi:hypothetical protein